METSEENFCIDEAAQTGEERDDENARQCQCVRCLNGGQDVEYKGVDYYDMAARVYGNPASQRARARFLKALVRDHKSWIGLNKSRKHFKVLDYGCATGILSLAFAPHIRGEIIGIDRARNMAAVYNELSGTSVVDSSKVTMKGFWGDLSCFAEDQSGMTDEVWDLNGEVQSFDLIAMSLVFDFLSFTDSDDQGNPEVKRNMKILIDRLKPGGTLLILDLERHYNGDDGVFRGQADPRYEGRKPNNFGSREVMGVLEALSMDSIQVSADHYFLWMPANEAEAEKEPCFVPGGRQEMWFMVKATKGERYAKMRKGTCTTCGMNLDELGAPPKRCRECNMEEYYCSEECQEKDLWVHRKICVAAGG